MTHVLIKKSIPVTGQADVVVAGGGLGGIAAALAAARAGASVILVETNGFVGGVATAGMCCSVFNCLFTRERRLAVRGIPLEIVDRLADEAGGPGRSWHTHKGHVIYDVERAKMVLAQMLEQAGVQLRLNSPVADVIMRNQSACALVTCGKNGLEAIECRVLVDATGDCDAAVLAGASVNECPSSRASYVFRLGNVDVDRYVRYFRDHPEQYPEMMDIEWTLEEALQQYDENGTFLFPHGGGMQLALISQAVKNGDLPQVFGKYDQLDAMQMHLIRETGICHVITGFTDNRELDAVSLTQRIGEGRCVGYLLTDCLKKYLPGFENAFICAAADDLGIRGSRAIQAIRPFTAEMKKNPSRQPDAIGVGVVEHHEMLYKGERAWSAQVFSNDVYEIPLSCLIPYSLDNVIIGSGRGADSNPPQLLRVMVTTMAVGQGAGVAAAVTAKAGVAIHNVNYQTVRTELIKQGVAFPEGVES